MFSQLLQSLQSDHQKRVALFAYKMGYVPPEEPIHCLSENTRLLLAKLILEETLELLMDGLKVEVVATPECDGNDQQFGIRVLEDQEIDPIEVIDGVCDVRFVATKILCVMGIPDEPFQAEVDTNNLMKFSKGHYYNDHGKLKKPYDHPEPNIRKILESLVDNFE